MTNPQRLFLFLASAASILFPAANGGAGTSTAATTTSAPAELDPTFRHGVFELQILEGVEFSQQTTSALRPNFDYELSVLRLGYMIDSAHQGGTFLRGNDELILEGIGGFIFQGPGNGLGGLSLLYRRNFLAPGARIVPYLTGGAGGIYSDAYHEYPQRALGSKGEFDLQASCGLRFRVSTRISLDAEVAYRHLSNADFASRNYGVNTIGGNLGLSCTF